MPRFTENETDPNDLIAPRRAAWPIDEAAFRLGIGRSSVYKLSNEGKLRLIKIAGRTLVPDEEIARLTRGGSQ
jgi:excisionase family DNA binding protein